MKLVGLLLIAMLFGLTVGAKTCTWTGGAGGAWTNAVNWGGTAPVSGDSLVFTGTTGLLTTNKFTSGTTFSNIVFDANAGSFTLNGNSFALTGTIANSNANLQTLGLPISCTTTAYVNTASGNITLNGSISGACRLYKLGSQTLTLGGNNSYTVGTTIGGGILSISTDNSFVHQLGGVTASCTLTFAGGSLAVTGGALYGLGQNWLLRNCVLGPGGGSVISPVELGHENYSTIGEYFTGGTLANGLTLLGGDITVRPGETNTLGKLTVGTGRCFLRNEHGNAYPLGLTDQVVVSNGAALVFVDTVPRNITNTMFFASGANLCNRTNAGVSSVETMTQSTTNITFPSAGQMLFNYDDQVTTNIVINGAWPMLTGNLLIQVGGNNATYGAVTLNGGFSGNYALSTAGSLTLKAASSHTGGTTVTGGTLAVQADGGLGAGTVTVNSGAVLTLSGGVTNGYINSAASLWLNSTAKANLAFTGTNTIAELSFDGGVTFQAGGTWGSSSSPAVNQSSLFTGTGVVNVILPTTTSVASSSNPSVYDQPASFTATVFALAGPPTGTVQFLTNGVNFGSAVTLSGGSASSGSLPTGLASGTYAVAAVYVPSGSFLGSSGTLVGGQTVNPLAVSLTGTRAYDGTASVVAGILTVANAVGGDDVSVVSGSGMLAGSTGGSQPITSFGTLALGGVTAGNYTLTAATGAVTITAGAPAQISVETAVDGSGTVVPSQSLVKNIPLTLYAIARDGGGDFVSNVSATWSVTNTAGGFVAGDLVPAGDGMSAVFTGPASGMGVIQAAANGWLGQSGLLAVPVDGGMIHLPQFEGAQILTAQPAAPNQSYWVNGTNNNQYVQWSVVAGAGVGGAAAVALPGPAASGGSANFIQALRTYYIPVWPNTAYSVRFSYQANGPGFSGAGDMTGSQMQFQALQSPYLTGGSFLSTAGMNIIYASTGWSNGVYNFTTLAGTHCLCFKFGVMFGVGNQTNPADSFYLDDDRGVTNVLVSTANPLPYGQSVSFTATVTPINPALGTPTGTVQFLTNGVDFGGAVTLTGGSAASAVLPSTLWPGNYTVTAVYSGDTTFTAGNGVLGGGQTIYLNTTFAYNGTAQGPAIGGIWPAGPTALTYAGTNYQGVSYSGTTAPTNAGVYSVANSDNGVPASQGFVILQATNALLLTSGANPAAYVTAVTFTGSIQTNGVTAGDATSNLVFAVDGVGVATNMLTNGLATYVASGLSAGAHNITVTYAGDNNYTNNATGLLVQNVNPVTPVFSGLTASQGINYGTAAVSLSGTLSVGAGLNPPPGETMTVTINGVQLTPVIADANGGFSVSFPATTIPVNGSPYRISYAYAGDGNFNAANDSSTLLTVTPAPATVSLGSLNQVYNGLAAGVTVTTGPASLAVGVTYNGAGSVPTNAGSYTVVATITNPNYQGAATNTLVIGQAAGMVTLTNLNQSYTGGPIGVRAITVPTNLLVNLTYNGRVNAPTNTGNYTVVGTISDPNYAGSVTNTLVVAQAAAEMTVTNLAQTYTGSPLSVSVATTPTNLVTLVTYDGDTNAPTVAGSYTVVATVEDANWAGRVTNTLAINQATGVINLTNLSQTYDGTGKGVAVTTVPPGLSVGLTYNGQTLLPTNSGSYTVVAMVNDTNYEGTVTNTLVINQAAALVSLSGLTQTYTGTGLAVTASTTPAGLICNLSYKGSVNAPTNAGDYTVVGTISDPNYAGGVTNTLVVDQAVAEITVTNLAQTYTGSPLSVSVATAPTNLVTLVTYDGDTNAPTVSGSYTMVATVVDENWVGSVTNTLVVSPATPIVTSWPTASAITYGQTLASSTLNGGSASVGGTFAWTTAGATPVAGTADQSVTFTLTDTTNYVAVIGATSVTVSQAILPVVLDTNSLSQTYDGMAKSVVVLSPTNLVVVTYDCSINAPTNAGDYTVVVTISDPNYAGSVTNTLVVGQAAAGLWITAEDLAQTYTGSPLSVSVVTAPTNLVVLVTYDGDTNAPMVSGSYTVVETVVDANYEAMATNTLVISPVTPIVTNWPAASTITYGQTLASSTLNGGSASVGGTFAWTTAGTTPVAETADQSVTFTPTDTTNYVAVIGATSVTVSQAILPVVLDTSSLSQTYDGTAKSVVVLSPTNRVVVVTYDGVINAPTNAGNYTVVALIDDLNYVGGATNTLVINVPIALNSTNVVASVSGNTLIITWPADHIGWLLQAQTNSLNIGLGTNWVDVVGSAATNSISITLDPSQPVVFYRLRYPSGD